MQKFTCDDVGFAFGAGSMLDDLAFLMDLGVSSSGDLDSSLGSTDAWSAAGFLNMDLSALVTATTLAALLLTRAVAGRVGRGRLLGRHGEAV